MSTNSNGGGTPSGGGWFDPQPAGSGGGQYGVGGSAPTAHHAAPKPSGGNADLMSLIHEAGFQGSAAQTMYAIVMAESGANTTAHNNKRPDDSYGLAQVNMIDSLGPQRMQQFGLKSATDLFDPLTNLKVAYALSNGGTNFSPWTTYTSGKYQQYMGQTGAQVHSSGATWGGGGSGGSGGFGGGGSASGGPNLTAADFANVDEELVVCHLPERSRKHHLVQDAQRHCSQHPDPAGQRSGRISPAVEQCGALDC
jgi:hypothetical protein